MASLLDEHLHPVAPGIEYRNNRVHWGTDTANCLSNEGRVPPQTLFDKDYDIIFYAYHSYEKDDQCISGTAMGQLGFLPTKERAETKHEFTDDGDQKISLVTKRESGTNMKANIDMPKRKDLKGRGFLLGTGCHLELLFDAFIASSALPSGIIGGPTGPPRYSAKFYLMNQAEACRAANVTDFIDEEDLYDIVDSRVEVFGKRTPLFLNPESYGVDGEEERDENEEKFAQEQLKSFGNMDTWWMKRHFPDLPDPVLLNIRCFLSPPPVFFLEEGDLWIHFTWGNDDRTVFIARARPGDAPKLKPPKKKRHKKLR